MSLTTTQAPAACESLTPEEQALVAELSLLPREDILKALKDNLQTAVSIELATIPIYLYTYYSINRNQHTGENITPAGLFANKAGAMIMSVAVEEMLHMSLSANILYSLGEDPELYLHSPGPYPTPLPYHKPMGPPGPEGKQDAEVSIPLGKLSYEQLWHFLQIERPEQADTVVKDRDWTTIGQFYSYIRCLICSPQITNADFTVGAQKSQIQSYNYSPNNIDTVSAQAPFDPWVAAPAQNGMTGGTGEDAPACPNGHCPSGAAAADFANRANSHVGKAQLLTVNCKEDALEAIQTICNQGEGSQRPVWFFEPTEPGATDDVKHDELSHYYKFLSLQAQMEGYADKVEYLDPFPVPPAPIAPTVTADQLAQVVFNFPENPTSVGYLSDHYAHSDTIPNYRPLSDLCNGIYQYMLILSETTYKVPSKTQKIYFNQAMHYSMIWILDKLIQGMRRHKLGDGTVLAPTFENIDLGHRKDAYSNLLSLGKAISDMPYAGAFEYYVGMLDNLPDVSPYWDNTSASTGDGAADSSKASDAPAVGQPGEPVPTPNPYAGAPAFPQNPPATVNLPPELPLHGCMGLNSCKGSDRFGIKGHEDPNNPGTFVPNDCAGQGYCSTTADHQCHVTNDCKNQGGCGLYGTAEEQENPGYNDCKSLGSCATPINAERFSTDGNNERFSVWQQARKVFEEKVYPSYQQQNPDLPKTLGPVPALFADTGPTYQWISDDNEERGNMTSCGASGLSGAGGCA